MKKHKPGDNRFTVTATRLLIAFIIVSCVCAFAEEPEYKVKAEFIERFTRFIDWPSDRKAPDPSDRFVICVIGENPFGTFLEELASNRKIKDRPVEVRKVTEFEHLKDCDLLFISKSEKDRLSQIIAEVEGKHVLTVGDTAGYAQHGVLINFYQEESNIRFEVNADAIQKSKLKFNARLLKLARIVEPSKHDAL